MQTSPTPPSATPQAASPPNTNPTRSPQSCHRASAHQPPSRSATALRYTLAALTLAWSACGGGEGAATPDTTTTDTTDVKSGPIAAVPGDRVGVAIIDITPKLLETYTDKDGDGEFDGCLDDPSGTAKNCLEPFQDANGNGVFDTAFLAGFGNTRAATGVHDPITVRALAFARGSAYAIVVSIDAIGLGGDHIQKALSTLESKGFDPSRVVVSSTHTHQGPDVRGMWGSQGGGKFYSGANPAYNAEVRAGIVAAVEQAAAALQPATLRVASRRLRDASKWFNGKNFGGMNPEPGVHGLIKDIRDPVVVSDQVLVVHAKSANGKGLATFIGFSGHPELVGWDNTLLSADYVHDLRQRITGALGGEAVFVAECLGGMQSGLGAPVPAVDEAGAWLWSGTGDAKVPVWIEKEGYPHARAFGIHVADAALAALAEVGEPMTLDVLQIRRASFLAPPDNVELKLMYMLGLFDLDPALTVRTPECPGWTPNDNMHPGCLPQWVYHVRLGPIELVSAPGEVFPELFWGLPEDDARWVAERSDASKRGADRGVYFPHHPPACDAQPWAKACGEEKKLGDCDCMEMHALPYRISDAADPRPAAALLAAKYKFLIGNGGDHLGYIVPEPDCHRGASQLSGDSGDHYEETVSLSFQMATLWRATLESLLAQSPAEAP